MVKRDRNHPCVILWSIGNEIDYPNDPYVTPLFKEVLGNNDANKPLAERLYDPRKPDAGRLAVLARELTRIVHALDDTRPVTSALSFPELSNRTGYADALDLSGYNYREQFYADDHKTFPDRVILGSENSHDPGAWFAVRDNPFISGQFLWTGIDFLGECRGWPIRISQAGMLDLAGFEKPLFFQRKALWTDKPLARLSVCGADAERPGLWQARFCWQGQPGEKKIVFLCANAPGGELFLNGRSLGEKEIGEDKCVSWTVPYEDGELRAVAGSASDALYTPGPAASLEASAVSGDPWDGEGIAQAEVRLLDAQGRPAPDEEVHVQVLGDACLLGIENGVPDDLTPYAAPYRRTAGGRLMVYLRRGTASPLPVSLHLWTASGLYTVLPLD